ncbi:unnamed protein product [Prunus armeniaca]
MLSHIALRHASFVLPSAPPCLATSCVAFSTPVPMPHLVSPLAPSCLATLLCDPQALCHIRHPTTIRRERCLQSPHHHSTQVMPSASRHHLAEAMPSAPRHHVVHTMPSANLSDVSNAFGTSPCMAKRGSHHFSPRNHLSITLKVSIYGWPSIPNAWLACTRRQANISIQGKPTKLQRDK